MSYSHIDNDQKRLTLHDCYSTAASLNNGVLSFSFEDGFWIASDHPKNPTGKTVRTDASKVNYYLQRGISKDCLVYVFCRRFSATVRKELSIEDLINKIKNKKCTIEFLYQYSDENARIIKCALHYQKRPYYEECQIELNVDKEEYLWNTIKEDCYW